MSAFEQRVRLDERRGFQKLIEHKQYIANPGEDMPEIRNWRWEP